MAVYRVISSYYTDILDTINIAYVQNKNDFEGAWRSLDKLHLIKKLAKTLVKIDRVQDTDRSYWHTQKRTYIWYIVILAIILAIISSVFVFFFCLRYLEYRERKDDPCAMTIMIKLFFIYIIIYTIIFSVFYLLMFNFGIIIKQCKAQLEKNSEDFNLFKGLLTSIPNGSLLDDALLYIGYIYKGDSDSANHLTNVMRAKIEDVNRDNDSGKSNTVDLNSLNNYYNILSSIKDATINQACLSSQLLGDVHDSLKNFFDDGNGYNTLKLMVVSSSNVYTLRELKRIMNFYYFMTLKKSTDNNPKINTDHDHLLIDQLIIKPIMDTTLQSILGDANAEIQVINKITQNLTPYQVDLSKYSDYFVSQIEFALAGGKSKGGKSSIVTSEQYALKVTQGENILNKLVENTSRPTLDNKGQICDGDNEHPNLNTIESSEDTMSFIKKLYQRISTEVYIKQQTSLRNLTGTNQGESKYYTPYGFLVNLNQIPYQDFKEGLEIQYLADVMQLFYSRISSAKDNYSLDDINYEGNKGMAVYQKFMSLSITVIVMGWGYYVTSWVDGYLYLKKEQKEKLEEFKEKHLSDVDDEETYLKNELKLRKLKAEHFKNILNSIILIFIVTAGTFFIVSLIFSSYIKKQSVHEYNIEIVEANTNDFKDSVNELLVKLKDFDTTASQQPLEYIGNIACIKDNDKFELLSILLNMIDKFEKCNYVLEAAKNKFPFPYSELTVDIFMIMVIVGGMVYLTSSFKPGAKFSQIMEWKGLARDLEDGILSEDDTQFERIKAEAKCHDDNVEEIVYTLKILMFIAVFLFLLYFSSKLLSSSNAFKQGIYNSAYFDKNMCYGK